MSEDINVKIGVHASSGPGILCKVCGDRASGKHYGVPSCDGCRGFFKRSIRRNLEYVCKEGERCVVDVSRRNQCQACRFSKCLQANMRREAVQHERAPRTFGNRTSISGLPGLPMDLYNARRLSMTSNGLFLPIPLQHIGNPNENQYTTATEAQKHFPAFSPTEYIDTLPFRSVPSDFAVQKLFNSGKINIRSQNIFGNSLLTHRMSPFSTVAVPSSCLAIPHASSDTLKSAKDDEVTSSEEHLISNTFILQPTRPQISNNFNKEAVFESAAKLLYLAVQWARAVPSFAQLSIKDQNLLLEESWAELFVVTAAQWGLSMDYELVSKEVGAKRLQKAINHFIGLQIDHTEAACLKALILFKYDCHGLVSTNQVAFLQDQTLNLLHEQCGGSRLGHILLLLPTVKLAADPQTLQVLLFKRTVGEVAIERLLGDLMNNN